MDTQTALTIIDALSQGINPNTGEVLPDESCFNDPQTIRALFIAKDALEKALVIERRKSRLPNNAGKPWTEAEDQQLALDHDNGTTIDELAQQHQRTKGSITSRLIKLGKLDEALNPYQRN